jgi:hypothetical protein
MSPEKKECPERKIKDYDEDKMQPGFRNANCNC